MVSANNRLHINRLLVPGILVAIVLAVVAVVAVILSEDGGSSESGAEVGGVGDAPADLISVRDSLPKFPDSKEFASEIFTGGSVLEVVYFADATPDEVVAFFADNMKASWPEISAARPVPPTDGKSAGGSEFTATNSSYMVGIVAIESDKDPSLGTTHISIRIERLRQ